MKIMKKTFVILSFCLCSHLLVAQMMVHVTSKNYQGLQTKLVQEPKNINFTQQIQHFTFQENKKNTFNPLDNQQQMPSAYAYKDLAFFCKIEVQLEKAVKLPVKFRLGSVDYVDYLEGKRSSY